jgi:hypothetical protein
MFLLLMREYQSNDKLREFLVIIANANIVRTFDYLSLSCMCDKSMLINYWMGNRNIGRGPISPSNK